MKVTIDRLLKIEEKFGMEFLFFFFLCVWVKLILLVWEGITILYKKSKKNKCKYISLESKINKYCSYMLCEKVGYQFQFKERKKYYKDNLTLYTVL